MTLTRSIKRKGGTKGKEGACHPSSDGQLLLDVELLDALAEGRAGDAQELGGLDLVAAGLAKGVDDEFALDRRDDEAKANPRAAARQLTMEFLGKLPEVREVLTTDVDAAFDGDPAAKSKEEVIVSYPFIEAIAVQRLAHVLYREGIELIPRIMAEWAHSHTGMDLHPGATIGTHFFIDHGTGTVIGETTTIGKRVKLYHGVTLGARSTSGGQQLRGIKRHPTIEDHVTIYPGATILGGETVIGAHSTIGGNVFLMDSVEPHSLVIYDGLDMRVLSKQEKAKASDYNI